MAWVQLTQKAIKARLSRSESDQYIAAAENATEFDMLDEIIAQTVALVRSKVAGCRANIAGMGPPGTIPEECLHAAATIAKSSLCASFPVAEGETDLRKTELANANTFLVDVSSCNVSITGHTETAPNPSPLTWGSGPKMEWGQ
jgi:hypothetical protein